MAVRSNTHTVEAQRHYEARSSERFNRISYAMEVLKLLNPSLKVAVYRNHGQLQVERGRGLGGEGPWALCGIPPHATREGIARALVELSGLEHEPFLLDLLCAPRASSV